MKPTLQSMLETKSHFNFVTGIMDNQQEDISSKTQYKTSFKFIRSKLNFSTIPASTSKQKKRKPIYYRLKNNTSDQSQKRVFVFLKNLFKDIKEPEMSKTNYSSSWQTSYKQQFQSNYIPPVKNKKLIIKSPDDQQPAVGYYNPSKSQKIRGSVRLQESQKQHHTQSLHSLLIKSIKQDDSPPQKQDQIKVPQEKFNYFFKKEKKHLEQQFELPLKELNDNPFKKQWQTFLAYKNKLKLLRDHKYEESIK